jgi:tetratricopeptide (TPR) repeat protein
MERGGMKRARLVRTGLIAGLAAWIVVGAIGEVRDLGTISFPTSGAPPAQEAFVRGVLLLHSFEFEDAGEAFREAQGLDPDFAMAYWGEAMSLNHPLWREQDREAALAVLERLAATPAERLAKAPTEREKAYLAAIEILYGEGGKVERDVAYAEAMRELSATWPEDLEAKAFHALAILGTTQGERDFATFMRAAAVAEEVFAANPRHPGAAHYLIHSYDDPVHAPLGLRAARIYADIAPAAAHAQHMISHIYVALGRWADSIDANVKSFEVSVDRAEGKGLGPDARNYHALHWLEYSRLQLGQLEAARRLLEEMDGYAVESGSDRARWHQAAFRAAWAVESSARDLPPGPDTEGMPFHAAVLEHFAVGFAASRRGDLDVSLAAAAAIRRRREEAVTTQTGERRGDIVASDLRVAEVMETQLASAVALARGEHAEALEGLGRAAAIEASLPLEYGPPSIPKPSHELLGEWLLTLDRPAEARAAFATTLERAPRRRLALEGLATATAALADADATRLACAELAAIYAHADESLPRATACNG